jgi:hypothetical protein
MSDFNYRGKLPFRVVSSSVNTGYNAELTAAVGHNIEIVNQHRDEYGALQDAPLQGPFTEQWVGGNQHRHIDLNDGADNSSNRPEAFLVSGSADKVRVYGPTHFDINAPKALLTRDGVSKSPVNLKNIRNESRRLGNFSHNYQVVQTSGRDINQSLIENNLTASGVLTTKFIKGVQEYSLPEEPNKKTVFVERFSAPGDYRESSRGALDRESEQYSPNNSLVTRNIAVRQKYNSQLTQHSAQFNSGSAEGITVHAVNRNTIKNIELSGTTFITASDYDNFWVQHAIPSTDLRYRWIAESVVDTGSMIQYQKLYDSQELVFNSSSFVVSGTNKQFPVDNIGINSLIKDKKSVDLTTNIFNVSSSVKLSASFSEIVNTPYGFSTWKEIRGAEHPVSRQLRQNNIISIEGDKKEQTKRSNSVKQFTESPVTNKFKPIELTLDIKGVNESYDFIFSHTNNLSTFANTQLSDLLGLDENSQQLLDTFRKFYSNPNRLNDAQNPINNLVTLKYSETLYPREVNAYLAETRGRTQYILDQAGTASRDGYDIQLGTQRAFWRDKLEDRIRSNNKFNSMDYQVRRLKGEPILYPGPADGIRDANYRQYTNNFFNYDYGTEINPEETVTFDFLPWAESIKSLDTRNQNKKFTQSSYTFTTTFSGFSNQSVIKGKIQLIDNSNNGELNSHLFLDYFYSSSISIEGELVDGTSLPLEDGESVLKPLTRVSDYSLLWQMNPFLFGEDEEDIFISYSSFSSSLPIPKPSYVAFLGGFESGIRNYTDFSDELSSIFESEPTGEIFSTLDSGLRYDEQSYGDKKCWFDSYEEYSSDIRNYAKDHSILPEFAISKHMPYYVTERGGNFRVKNNSYLELDGVGKNYRSSLTASNTVYDKIFIDSYVTTDNLDNEKIQKENSNLLKLQNIKFRVSGIKKLLPYNGFYPQDRTIQLANLFNNFLDNNVGGGSFRYGYSFVDEGSNNRAITFLDYYVDDKDNIWSKNVIMPYFFAPGILYNTIKSGISVDFPVITASSPSGLDDLTDVYEPNTTKKLRLADQPQEQVSVFSKYAPLLVPGGSEIASSNRKDPYYFSATILKKGALKGRLPFESLIFPEKYIPKVKFNTSSFREETEITGAAELTFVNGFDSSINALYNSCVAESLISIKFDCNIRPDIYEQNLYVGTTRVGDYINIGTDYKNFVPFAFLNNSGIVDPSYSMAMSNFLAEIPRFFLKNGSMNVFKSSELKDWKVFEIGKKYYFDLIMKKSEDLVMMESYASDRHITGSSDIEKTFNGRYFGWPVSKQRDELRTVEEDYVAHNDPAYAPFTPPYFEGEARLRFELSASKSSYSSVAELFKDIVLTDSFKNIEDILTLEYSEALAHKMSIKDCMEVFGVGLNPIASFDGPNSANSFEQIPNSSKEYWAISPKLETPVLDFSEQEFADHTGSYWSSSGYGRGMWSGYGKIPTGSKGISIEIVESFPLQLTNRTNSTVDISKTGSLLKQVGFTAESTKLGQLAETKTISEAIVMIPYVDNRIAGVTTFVDNHHFFALNKEAFATLKQAADKGIPAVIPNEKIGYETSMTKMIKSMKKYVIPPAFNFLKYENIDPFAMYIFEFNHDLDQQDLADIWQGVMPKIAINAEHDIVEFEHKVGPLELFEENFTPPENMRWMVFKVKKKAEWNYFAITENIADDQNFKFKFSNSQEAKTPDYSYNWPYDYFSLVELAKVDISLTYDQKPQTSGSLVPTVGQFNISDFTGNVAVDDFYTGNKKAVKKATVKTRKVNKKPGKKS